MGRRPADQLVRALSFSNAAAVQLGFRRCKISLPLTGRAQRRSRCGGVVLAGRFTAKKSLNGFVRITDFPASPKVVESPRASPAFNCLRMLTEPAGDFGGLVASFPKPQRKGQLHLRFNSRER